MKMEYGVIYWQDGIATYRECTSASSAWHVFNNAPQPLDSFAQCIIDGKKVKERYEAV